MKTHELAQTLSLLARVLKSGPDVDLTDFKVQDPHSPRTSHELAVNLNTLISLSNIDKARWIELIDEYKFPIDFRPRDGTRDVLGKLFAYLVSNPDAQEQLKKGVNRDSGTASPELMKALGTLLKGTTHEPPASRD